MSVEFVRADIPGIDAELSNPIKVPAEKTGVTGLLIDFDGFPDRFNGQKARTDCEVLLKLINTKPDAIDKLIRLVKPSNSSRDNQAAIATALADIGLTETEFARHGGGFLWLLVLLAAGCAHFGSVVKKPGAEKPPK